MTGLIVATIIFILNIILNIVDMITAKEATLTLLDYKTAVFTKTIWICLVLVALWIIHFR